MNAQYDPTRRCLYVSRPYPRLHTRRPVTERTKVAVTGAPGFEFEGKAWFYKMMDRATIGFVDPIIMVYGHSLKIIDKLTLNWATENWFTQYVYYMNNTYRNQSHGAEERENEFISVAEYLIAFWDEEDEETRKLIKKAKRAEVKTRVFTF